MHEKRKYEEATLGGGCFWCLEAVFKRLRGVVNVEPGYAGGSIKNPAYREVCTGRTGHAEVVRINFDPSLISYEDLLRVFWHIHDPTTLNRQGADVGTQYRSVIFYHNEKQKEIALRSKSETETSGLWPDPIVTAIEPLRNYYPAEDYHRDYYDLHGHEPYCSIVIAPKIAKLQREFSSLLS